MSRHYTTGDVIDVRVEKIVPRGFGLAFAENLTVLIPLTAPGDDVRVRIREIKQRMAFAEVVDIKQPGPQRTAPACEYFGKCGGCDFQQMTYAEQLEAKVGLVRDCLRRIGKIDYEDDIAMVESPNPLGYRSRARWHIDPRKQAIGYHARDSHKVINIDACPILTPGLQSTLEYIRESMDWEAAGTEKSELEAATGDEGRVSTFSTEDNKPSTEISYTAGGETYAFSAQTFFQANKFLAEELIGAAVGDASGKMAFDLYSGVGLFTLPLARRFGKVVAVEENPAAADLAKKNVGNAGLANVKVIASGVEKFFAANKIKKVDLLVLDPPRAGTEKTAITSIAALKPANISYVSCEPSILARDLRILLDAGYSIDKITALDLFPQTHHVETVVHLHI